MLESVVDLNMMRCPVVTADVVHVRHRILCHVLSMLVELQRWSSFVTMCFYFESSKVDDVSYPIQRPRRRKVKCFPVPNPRRQR
nr:hypothetical protein CFP56_21054 [Quercus suber]